MTDEEKKTDEELNRTLDEALAVGREFLGEVQSLADDAPPEEKRRYAVDAHVGAMRLTPFLQVARRLRVTETTPLGRMMEVIDIMLEISKAADRFGLQQILKEEFRKGRRADQS